MIKKKAYLVGIKGVAMTALAVYLKEKGYYVTGSDVVDTFITDEILKASKIEVKEGFSPKNIKDKFDLVIVTGAHGGMTNPEAVYAKSSGMPTYMHGVAIGKLMKNNTTISISGCHGKTTTASLTASLLTKAKFNPSYIIGTSDIKGLGPAGHFGRGKYFIAEADEYMTCPITDPTPRFLWQNPYLLVITNIDYDHPDAYANINKVKNAFSELIKRVDQKGITIACVDNENVRSVISTFNKNNFITYGFSPRADYHISKYYFGEGASFMKVKYGNMEIADLMIRIPGKHNLLNALAAGIVANQTGLGWDRIKELIKFYTGCKRRFEKIGQYDNILLYDDYAHHPSEIKATLSAAKDWYKKRIIVIFQPHTFSRTKSLLKEFGKAFVDADIAIIPDIYPSAREKADKSISSNDLVVEINKNRNNAYYKPTKSSVLDYLQSHLQQNDIIITMGAGDIFSWKKEIIQLLKNRYE